MCGVAGIFVFNQKPISDVKSKIWRMTKMLSHRGPDNQDVYISADKTLALGNTRLSIVHPTCNLKQPLERPDRGAVLSFNGEIYNYAELKKELEARNIKFRSHMDTEVLLEGLYLDGPKFLDKLDGMWAFAYYDVETKNLILSRDIMGERHIFYYLTHDYLCFASEIPALISVLEEVVEMDFEAILTSIQYSAAPPGKSLIKGINRLPPGCNLTVSSDGKAAFTQYRKLRPEKWFEFFRQEPSFGKVVEIYEEMFHNTCKRRIPTEVPYICTLSGGIDSSLVCLFASDFGKTQIKTLHALSQSDSRKVGSELSERDAAQYTASKLNTDHSVFEIYKNDCIPILLHEAQNAFDGEIEGVAPFEMLALHARKSGYKVMLISDGPDELLGGYLPDIMGSKVHNYSEAYSIRYHTAKMISRFKVGERLLSKLGYHRQFIDCLKNCSFEPFWSLPIHWSFSLEPIAADNITGKVGKHYGKINSVYADIIDELDFSQRCALAYASNSLPEHFNLRSDKAFLQQSVEVRLPHQAPDMVEFLIAMPSKFRFEDNNKGKKILRQVVKQHIGEKVSSRSKFGFAVPLWKNTDVYKAMNFEEVIQETSLFEDFPFKKGTRNYTLNNKKLLPRMYKIAKTYERLKELQKQTKY